MVSDKVKVIEQQWINRADACGLKYGSMKYKQAEVEFFCGAMAALHATDPNAVDDKMSTLVPPIWIVNIMSGRPVAERRNPNA